MWNALHLSRINFNLILHLCDIPKGRDSNLASRCCSRLTGAVEESHWGSLSCHNCGLNEICCLHVVLVSVVERLVMSD